MVGKRISVKLRGGRKEKEKKEQEVMRQTWKTQAACAIKITVYGDRHASTKYYY